MDQKMQGSQDSSDMKNNEFAIDDMQDNLENIVSNSEQYDKEVQFTL
jgi:hypothetical protein